MMCALQSLYNRMQTVISQKYVDFPLMIMSPVATLFGQIIVENLFCVTIDRVNFNPGYRKEQTPVTQTV